MKHEFDYAVFTDVGSREINEDSLGIASKDGANCYILCDGLGGHGMGDAASGLVVDVFRDQFSKTDSPAHFLGKAFQAGQDILMAEQIRRHATKKMKTTAVSVVTDAKHAYIGHIGDSRAYVFSGNKVKTRTKDHSIPQMLAIAGDIKENEIRHHPDRNIVLRVMGVEWESEMYELMKPIPLRKCQAFLLCSDGFWELIEEEEMCALLQISQTPQEWLEQMVQIVRRNGQGTNMDNFSAIAVWHR